MLSYFDEPLRKAHHGKPRWIAPEDRVVDWDKLVRMFKDSGGSAWIPSHGAPPGMGGCRAPIEVLERYGFINEKGAEKVVK